MKRTAILLGLLSLVLVLVIGGCKKKVEPTPPEQPRVEQPKAEEPKIEQPKVEEPITIQESQFQTVYFDFDKYNLRSDGKSALDVNAGLLKQFPDVIVRIEGHCDERGTVEYNLSLGEKRARACMEYLNGLGIAANRVSVISYGEERPAVSGSDESAWSKNRRCEFKIISK